jgi:hypothetical protein
VARYEDALVDAVHRTGGARQRSVAHPVTGLTGPTDLWRTPTPCVAESAANGNRR